MSKTKALCNGCYDDFYNQNRDGGCWMFAKAKIVERTRVGTWQNPPYQWTPKPCLTCYKQTGSSFIKEDDVRIETAKATP